MRIHCIILWFCICLKFSRQIVKSRKGDFFCVRMPSYLLTVIFQFMSLVCFIVFQIAPVENDNSYDELKRDAKLCLSLMSQGLLYPHQVPLVLQVLKQVRMYKNIYIFWLEFWFIILRISQSHLQGTQYLILIFNLNFLLL